MEVVRPGGNGRWVAVARANAMFGSSWGSMRWRPRSMIGFLRMRQVRLISEIHIDGSLRLWQS